jgi:PleD family two-component response regulator
MFTEGDRDVQDLIERADQGLYFAKKTGRNRISLAPAAEARSALVA